MSEFRTVAKVADVGPGDIVPVTVGDIEMIVYRSGDELYAAQRWCLHQRADLVDGLVSRGFLICAQHGWRYHCDTGVHEMSPENCLVTYRVRVAGDDIQIDPTPIRNARSPE